MQFVKAFPKLAAIFSVTLRVWVVASLILILTACEPSATRLEFPDVTRVVEFERVDVDTELLEFLDQQIAQIQENPGSSALRGRLAMSFDANEFKDAALATYEQAAVLDPFDFKWAYMSSLVAAANGNHEVALQKLDQALLNDPLYVAAWMWKGTWSIELGLYSEAKAAFQRAYQIAPNPPALIGMTQANIELGECASAVDVLEELAVQFPHPHVQRLLAKCYRELGDESKLQVASALGSYPGELSWDDQLTQQLVSLVRGYGGRLTRAQKLLQGNRSQEAIVELNEIRARFPVQPSLVSTFAWAYAADGSADLAINELLIGIEEFVDHQPFYTQLGDLLFLQGHVEDALTLLQHATQLNPRDPQALELLAKVLVRQEKFEEAERALDKALELGSINTAELHMQLGLIAGLKRDWPNVIDHLSKVVELDPRNARGHVLLSRAYEESDDEDQARQTLEWAQLLGFSSEQLEAAIPRIETDEESSE